MFAEAIDDPKKITIYVYVRFMFAVSISSNLSREITNTSVDRAL